eukprot:15095226-Alexandrium_andersonii.AAC.1
MDLDERAKRLPEDGRGGEGALRRHAGEPAVESHRDRVPPAGPLSAALNDNKPWQQREPRRWELRIKSAPNRRELPPNGAPANLWELQCSHRRSRRGAGSRIEGAARATRRGGLHVGRPAG